MAGPGILYLDVDDEITSAAARIRRSEAARVAVVLPYGSRLATSRINFRLLARDALLHEKRLSIVAPDGATRALAASAGLPVFATVAEYEGSLAEEDRAADDTRRASSSGGSEGTTGSVPPAAGGAAAAGAAAMAASEPPASPRSADAAAAPARAAPEPGAATTAGVAATTAGVAATRAATERTSGPRAGGESVARAEPTTRADPVSPPRPAARSIPVIGSGRGAIPRVPVLVAAAVLGLVVLVGGVAAWILLPSATIVVTPHERLVGPQTLTVVAETDASEPDPEAGIVPAEVLTLDAEASGTFEATGVRTEQTRAEGRVTFTSYDTRGPNTIPAGSVIATEGGIRFRTMRSVTLPRADIVPPTSVSPTTASVAVEAVRQGPEGNVPANAITLVPAGEDPVITKVRNGEATTGGSRTEFPIVSQADIDAALATLQEQLEASFRAQLADPSIAPPGATIFPDTAVLGSATPTTDPAGLVDLEQETFELGLAARGTVVAVDPAPVEEIARLRLESLVSPGSTLVEGSVRIEPGAPVVEGQQVSFPVEVRASQVAIPDADELRALVVGRTAGEAETLLAPYGDVEVTLWPDWVGSVPTLEGRVSIEIAPPIPAEEPPATPAPTPDPTPSAAPSTTPDGSASPVP